MHFKRSKYGKYVAFCATFLLLQNTVTAQDFAELSFFFNPAMLAQSQIEFGFDHSIGPKTDLRTAFFFERSENDFISWRNYGISHQLMMYQNKEKNKFFINPLVNIASINIYLEDLSTDSRFYGLSFEGGCAFGYTFIYNSFRFSPALGLSMRYYRPKNPFIARESSDIYTNESLLAYRNLMLTNRIQAIPQISLYVNYRKYSKDRD